MPFPIIKVYDKELKHYIVPWEGKIYDEVDLIYADENWYILGGTIKLTEDRYIITMENK